MFGYIIPDYETLTKPEQNRYQYAYCGLCKTLGERYGALGKSILSYDMTFLAILLSSIYHPEEITGEQRCVMHPGKRPYLTNSITEYAADMNILLAYYQCLDDWNDDHKITARTKSRQLEKYLPDIKSRWPRQFQAVEEKLEELGAMEKANELNPDHPANCFGQLLGEIFVLKDDEYAGILRGIGEALGRFVYLMDACIDLKEDIKKERYNPLIAQTGADYEGILTMIIGECTAAFEQAPLQRDVNILRNVLYSGVWLKYNAKKKEGIKNG